MPSPKGGIYPFIFPFARFNPFAFKAKSSSLFCISGFYSSILKVFVDEHHDLA